MTRILHLLQHAEGGGWVHARRLASDAIEHGARPVLVVPGAPPREEREIEVARLPDGRAARTRAIARMAHGADLLHVHGTRAGSWAVPIMPFARSVVTMHGLHPLHRPGGHSYRLAGRALVGAVAAAADATICVSHADAAMLATLRPRPRGVTVVRNGIDPPAAIGADERAQARATLDLGDDVLAVLVLARLTEAKDMPTTLAAARALEDDGVVVLVAGRGELENEVRAGAGPSVRLLGHRTDVRQLLAASDVLLTTSLWEGMPLAVLEAMGAGRAVVASAAAGNAEAVGDAGLLVAIGDAAGFAAAIRSLRDPTRRAALGDAARERVLANFAIADQLAATAAVYSIVLDRPVW